MLRWFRHVVRMDVNDDTNLYVDGNMRRGRLRRTYFDQIPNILKKDQVESIAYLKRLM